MCFASARVGTRSIVRAFEHTSENTRGEQRESFAPVDATQPAVSSPVGTPRHRVRVPRPVVTGYRPVPDTPQTRCKPIRDDFSPWPVQDTEERSRGRLRALQHVSPLHTTEHERGDTEHEAQRAGVALSPVSSGPPGVAILTVLTRPKSQQWCAITRAKEIGCYRQRGRGEGVRPRAPALGRGPHRPCTCVFGEGSTPCRHVATGGGGSASHDEGLSFLMVRALTPCRDRYTATEALMTGPCW